MTDHPQTAAPTLPARLVEQVLLGDIVQNCLAPLSFFLILLITVDGLVPQVEMLLSGGRVPVPTLVLKAALVMVVVFAALLGNGWKNDMLPIWIWCVFVGYLLADSPHLMAQQLSPFIVFGSYYGNYSLILILPFVGTISRKLEARQMTRVLFFVFWICAAMGIAQYLTHSPILFTASSDGNFEVISWTLFGTDMVRSFSFFVYSINFGLFCTLIGAMGLYAFLEKSARIGGLFVFLVATLCVYCTLTRVVYLVFFIATLTVLFLCFGKSVKYLYALPVFGFGVGGVLAYGGVFYLGGGKGIADNVSLLERIAQFAYYWAMFTGGSVSQKLFGLGITQDSKVNGQAIYPIDNLFMAILLHIGIVGLIIVLVLFWLLYKRISILTKERPSPLRAGVCAVWSSFWAISLFDISIAFFVCSAMLFMLGSHQRLTATGMDRTS